MKCVFVFSLLSLVLAILLNSCGTLEISENSDSADSTKPTVQTCGKTWQKEFTLDSTKYNSDSKRWIINRTKPSSNYTVEESFYLKTKSDSGETYSLLSDYPILKKDDHISIYDPGRRILGKVLIIKSYETCSN